MSKTTYLAFILILLKVFTFSTANGQSLDPNNSNENCFSLQQQMQQIKELLEKHIKSTTDESHALGRDLAFVKLRFIELKENLQDVSKMEHSLSTLKQDFLQQKNSFNEIKTLITDNQHVTVKESLAVQRKFEDLENTLTIREVSSCEEAYQEGGIYRINLPKSGIKPFNAYCQPDSDGGNPWTIIQRRVDNTTDFYRGWDEYKNGFGNITGNYWIGLEKIHALTRKQSHELWVLLEDFDGVKRNANYSAFAIGNENSKYKVISQGEYNGNAGDALQMLTNQFSTYDSDNDVGDGNCATVYHSAWWFDDCHRAQLNGDYYYGEHDDQGHGIIWNTFRGNKYSLKFTQMAIRPVN